MLEISVIIHEQMKPLGDGNEVCYVFTMGWLYNEELLDLFSLPGIIGVIKSRRMGWAGEEKCSQDFSWKTCSDTAWKTR
jgi:hypothetical protein